MVQRSAQLTGWTAVHVRYTVYAAGLKITSVGQGGSSRTGSHKLRFCCNGHTTLQAWWGMYEEGLGPRSCKRRCGRAAGGGGERERTPVSAKSTTSALQAQLLAPEGGAAAWHACGVSQGVMLRLLGQGAGAALPHPAARAPSTSWLPPPLLPTPQTTHHPHSREAHTSDTPHPLPSHAPGGADCSGAGPERARCPRPALVQHRVHMVCWGVYMPNPSNAVATPQGGLSHPCDSPQGSCWACWCSARRRRHKAERGAAAAASPGPHKPPLAHLTTTPEMTKLRIAAKSLRTHHSGSACCAEGAPAPGSAGQLPRALRTLCYG